MSTRNYEEYRAQALAELGEDYTVEDLRNEEKFRKKVLDGLGAEYTDEDTHNFERYRLKVLENLSGGGGGGGGFTTAKVKVIGKANTVFWGSDNKNITGKPIYGILEYGDHFYTVHTFDNAEVGDTTYNVIMFETGEKFPAFQFNVEAGESVTASGNCTVVNPSTDMYVVLFTGDCTITIS